MEKISRESFDKMVAGHDKEKQAFINKAHKEALRDNVAINAHEMVMAELKGETISDEAILALTKTEDFIRFPNSLKRVRAQGEKRKSGSSTKCINLHLSHHFQLSKL